MKKLKKLSRCFFVWRVAYPKWAELEESVKKALANSQPVVIVTHDVGLCEGNVPGRGNTLLAQALARMSTRCPTVPILAQLGVAIVAQELGIHITKVIGPPSVETPLSRSTNSYNSKTVVSDQKRWLLEQGMFPALALTVAIPLHMGRVSWIMEKEGFTVLPVPLLSPCSRDYADKRSLYFSIRIAGRIPGGISVLYAREILARLLFLKNGWI